MDLVRIKKLRNLTESSLGECKRALSESNGDLYQAAAMLMSEEEIARQKNHLISRVVVKASQAGLPEPQEILDIDRILEVKKRLASDGDS